MKWIEVCIEANIDITEEVSIILLEAGANGTQIQNPEEIKFLIDEAGATELADYGDFSQILDKYKIIAYFTTGTDLKNLKAALNEKLNLSKAAFIVNSNDSKVALNDKMNISKTALSDEEVDYKFLWREVDDSQWKGNWKKYYKPFNLTDKLRVVPSWEAEEVLLPDVIIMDPGMAFGTGTHESTSLCVSMIEDRIQPGDLILDIGTGTGILSIAASKLGAEFSIAVDIDAASVKTAKQNFYHNGISNAIAFLGELKNLNDFVKTDTFKAAFNKTGKATFETKNGFDMIAANIVSDVIIDLADDMKKYLKKGGSLVCSGIITEREKEVEEALIKAGFENLRLIHKNEWTAITADA